MTHHGSLRKSSNPGETLRSRLFCRQSDPHALLAGLHCVESCRDRLMGVVRSLGELIEVSEESGARQGHPGGGGSIEQAVLEICEAVDELAQCAISIQTTTTNERVVAVIEDVSRATGSQEHYPELFEFDASELTEGTRSADSDDRDRVVTRCRLQIAAVKDRYSVVLPGLPWVGPDRDHFTGSRLTKVRVHLEAAVEALETAVGAEPSVDLTDSAAALVAG